QPFTTYVISSFSPNGHYSDDQYYFGRTGVDRWPLHALRSAVDGPNGVFNYGASGFPSETWFSDNYWVDVVFTPDLTAPTVSLTVSISSPANTATVRGSVSVTAAASDNQGVAGVQFLVDGATFGAEVTAPPYTITWSTTALANNSTHTLAARARDTSNNVTT